jgi:hypothetical protein
MMTPRRLLLIEWVVLLMILLACQLGQPVPAAMPTATVALKPTLTPIPLPPAITPTLAQPTPTNTRVVIATYTPQPTPTTVPTRTPTPTSELPPTASPTPASPGPSSRVEWADTDGEPVIVPGQDEGYFLWTDGDRVHLRAATKGNKYIFSGQVTGNGAIVSIEKLAPDAKITVSQAVNRFDFEWTTAGGPDGLDFTFTGARLILNLFNQGEPKLAANLIFVGKDKVQAGNPLELVR